MSELLWVRTPLRLQVWGHAVQIDFMASDQPAGEAGARLKAGRGAWVDRALSADEPAIIVVDDVNPDVLNTHLDPTVTQRAVQQDVQSVINGFFPSLLETLTLRAALLTDGTRIGFQVERRMGGAGPIGIFSRDKSKGVFECVNGYGKMPRPPSSITTQPYIILPVERQ